MKAFDCDEALIPSIGFFRDVAGIALSHASFARCRAVY